MASDRRPSYWGLAIVATGVMVALKATGEIAWPWLVVTGPLWVPLALSVSVRLALLAVILGVVWWIDPGGLAGEVGDLAARLSSWLAP